MLIKFIVSIILTVYSNLSFGQQFDSSLNNYQIDIIKFLKNNSGLIDLSRKDSTCFTLLYSRRIDSFYSTQVSFFEIGIIGTHSKKYLCILIGKEILLLKTKDFNSDFDDIINAVTNCSEYISAKTIAPVLVDIKGMYDYNNHPPWRKNTFRKE
jgi:hypothetical protein